MSVPEVDQQQLIRRIGRALLGAAPPNWKQIRAEYRSAGRHIEADVAVTTNDEQTFPIRPPMDVVELFGELRAAMYRPGRGTWLSGVYLLDHPSKFSAEFEPDTEPRWRRMPPPIGFQDELRQFPREDAHIPEWLRARAGLPPAADQAPGSGPAGAGPAAPPGTPAPGGPPPQGAAPAGAAPGPAAPAPAGAPQFTPPGFAGGTPGAAGGFAGGPVPGGPGQAGFGPPTPPSGTPLPPPGFGATSASESGPTGFGQGTPPGEGTQSGAPGFGPGTPPGGTPLPPPGPTGFGPTSPGETPQPGPTGFGPGTPAGGNPLGAPGPTGFGGGPQGFGPGGPFGGPPGAPPAATPPPGPLSAQAEAGGLVSSMPPEGVVPPPPAHPGQQ